MYLNTLDKVEAVVIGGGTIGTACLWHLAKRGMKKIVLIERNNVGTGNTSKAASLMTQARTKAPMIPLIQETYRNIEEAEDLSHESVGKKKVGTLNIAVSKNAVSNLETLVEVANKYEIKNREATIEEINQKVPWIDSSKIIKASFMEDDSFVDAYVMAKVLLDAAKIKGAEVMQNTEVLEIVKESNTVKGVKTSKGDIECNYIIDAAGAWANQLSLQVNVAIPMAPVRSIYWITEKNSILFPEDQPMVTLPDAMAYTRPESGSLLFGLREENSLYFHPEELTKEPHAEFLGNPEDQWDIIMNDGQEFASLFPEFESLGIKNCITGISTYTPDGYYTFGGVDTLKGFYVAAGCAGAGVAGAGGIGRMIAEMIFEKKLFADPEPFSINRFGKIDPMSQRFMQRCAEARSKKKDGG